MSAVGEPIPTSVQEAGAASLFPPRKPLPEGVRSTFREHKIVGGQPVSSETVLVGGDQEKARDEAAQEGILSALAAAHSEDGVDPGIKRKNVGELAHFAVIAGISEEEVKARLEILGEDPDSYFPPENIEDRDDPSDAQVNGDLSTNKQGESTPRGPETPTQTSAEQEAQAEKIRILRQEEARHIGRRVLAIAPELALKDGEGVKSDTAVGRRKLLQLISGVNADGWKVLVGSNAAQGLDLQGSGIKLPISTVKGATEGNLRFIQNVTGGDNGQRQATCVVEYQQVQGGAYKQEVVTVSMSQLMEAQFKSDAKALIDALPVGSDQRRAAELYHASLVGGDVAKQAFGDLSEVESTLLSAAKASGMLTRTDVQSYIQRARAGQAREQDGNTTSQLTLELDSLESHAREIIMVTPDMVKDLANDIGKIDPKTFDTKIHLVEANLRQMKLLFEQQQSAKDSSASETFQKVADLMAELEAVQGMREAVMRIGDGTAGGLIDTYFRSLEDGTLNKETASSMTAAFREGDYIGMINHLLPEPIRGENQSLADFQKQVERHIFMKNSLKKGGFTLGIILLIMSSLVSMGK